MTLQPCYMNEKGVIYIEVFHKEHGNIKGIFLNQLLVLKYKRGGNTRIQNIFNRCRTEMENCTKYLHTVQLK